MAHHPNAWAGIEILIFGNQPLLPMQIEQTLAEGSANNEIAIQSFEDYGQAFDHCKKTKNVGMILLSENTGTLEPLNVFQQLAKPFEENKGPCLGLLLHDGTETVKGYSVLRFSQGRIIDYTSKDEFLNPERANEALSNFWIKYMTEIESIMLPSALSQSLKEIIAPTLSIEKQIFLERVVGLLTARLSLSFWEALALKWHPVSSAIKSGHPDLWETQHGLQRLQKQSSLSSSQETLEDVLKSTTTLANRCARILEMMAANQEEQELGELLQRIGSFAKPGSPGLFRQLAKATPQIMGFWRQSVQQYEKKTG